MRKIKHKLVHNQLIKFVFLIITYIYIHGTASASGEFIESRVWQSFLGFSGQKLTVGDYNGDGRDDIASAFGDGRVFVTLSNGRFFDDIQLWNDRFSIDDEVFLSGDFNGDGKDDVVTFVGDGRVYVATSNGSGFINSLIWHENFGYSGEKLSVGDYNGDGMDDIATAVGDGRVFVALSNGSTFYGSSVWHDFFSFGNEVFQSGDFNGDGKDDVVTFVGDGRVYVATSNGSGFINSLIWHENFGYSGEKLSVGDYNGDGKDDIATAVGDGRVFVVLSDVSTFYGSSVWHDFFSFGNEVFQSGDFNGDGIYDIVTFSGDEFGRAYVAESNFEADDELQILAHAFAPVLAFHENEVAFPSTVDFFLANTRLTADKMDFGSVTPESLGESRQVNGVNSTTKNRKFVLRPPSNKNERRMLYEGMNPDFSDNAQKLRIYAHSSRRMRKSDSIFAGFEIQYYIFFPRDPGARNIEKSVPLYAHFFVPFISVPAYFLLDNVDDPYRHDGDWEAVVVHLDTAGNFEKMFFPRHGDSPIAARFSNQIIFANADGSSRLHVSSGASGNHTHPMVFIARDKHASYEKAGEHKRSFPKPPDVTSDKGVKWSSTGRVVMLGDLLYPKVPWLTYGGRWGASSKTPEGPAFKNIYCSNPVDPNFYLSNCNE